MNNNKFNLIPYYSSQTVKGLAIILVLFHHLAGSSREILWLHPFLIVGSLACSIFFFYSGYGMQSSFNKDVTYLKDYPKKRLLKVVVPFLVANLLFVLILSVFDFINLDNIEIFLNIIGIQLIDPNKWYVIATIFLYIGFYCAHRYIKNKLFSVLVVLISILLYGVVYKTIGAFFSMICFPLGMIFSYYEVTIKKFTSNNIKLLKTILFINILLFVYLFFIVYDMNNIFNTPLRAITVTLFDIIFVTLMIIGVNIKGFSNKILSHFGDLSMDLYFMHGLAIAFYSKYFEGTFLSVMIYFILSYLISLVFKQLRNFL